jgi:hypothetical protein
MKWNVESWHRQRRLKKFLKLKIKQELEGIDSDTSQSDELEERAKRIKNFQDLIQAAYGASSIRRLEKVVVASALFFALAAVTVLVFKTVNVTDVEIALNVSDATFVLAQDSPVLQPITVSEVQIFETKSVKASAQKEVIFDSPEGGVARISSARRGPKDKLGSGVITLPGLSLPKGTTVSIKAVDNYRFLIGITPPEAKSDPIALDITGKGPVDISLSGDDNNNSESLNLESPYPIHVVPLNKDFTLALSITPDSRLELLPQIPVSHISFQQQEAESEARQISAIKSGYIIRTELGSEKLDLRPFEPLNVQGCNWEKEKGCLRLRRLAMSKDGADLSLYGNVINMTTGQVSAERELMPSLLEWINSNHRIKLLWTAVLFASGLILGLIRWMTKST